VDEIHRWEVKRQFHSAGLRDTVGTGAVDIVALAGSSRMWPCVAEVSLIGSSAARVNEDILVLFLARFPVPSWSCFVAVGDLTCTFQVFERELWLHLLQRFGSCRSTAKTTIVE
jgi:hypothetical protein